jgi:hypothetical protein
MNFMYCIACGCITVYVVELPATFSTWHMIYHFLHMLVHMVSVISVNRVYIWFTHGCSANSLAYHCSLGFIIETEIVNSVGLLWMSDQPHIETCLYLTTHNTHKRQTSIPPVVFEPAIPATERLQTHTQDRTATGIGSSYVIVVQKFQLLIWCSGSDSTVCIAVCYVLDGLGIESQWKQHSLHPSRPTLGPTQPPIQRVLGLFPRIKRPGPDVYHPPPSSSEVKLISKAQDTKFHGIYLYSTLSWKFILNKLHTN